MIRPVGGLTASELQRTKVELVFLGLHSNISKHMESAEQWLEVLVLSEGKLAYT